MYSKLFFFISGLLLLSCNQKLDNPLSSSYDGNYDLDITWPDSDTLELFRFYSIEWNPEGEEYDSYEITTEPQDLKCEELFRKNRTGSSSVLYFSSLFREGKVTLKAIRPNGKIDTYSCTLSISNPFYLKGDSLGGIENELAFRVERKDRGPTDNLEHVIWEIDSKREMLHPQEHFKYTPTHTGTHNLLVRLVNGESDTIELETFNLKIPGYSPQIEKFSADSTVAPGEQAHFTFFLSDMDEDSMAVLLVRGNESFKSNFFSYSEARAGLQLEMPTNSADSVVYITVIDKSGLVSETESCIVTVEYQQPAVTFLQRTITVPTHKDYDISVLSQDAVRYTWWSQSGTVDTTTTEPKLKISSAEEITDTLYVTGTDLLDNTSSPDTLIISFRSLPFDLQLYCPDSVALRSWTTFRASVTENGTAVEGCTFQWDFHDTSSITSTPLDSDSVSVYVKDSVPWISFTLKGSVNGIEIPEITRSATVLTQLPSCDFDTDTLEALVQEPISVDLEFEYGHESRPVRWVFFSINNGAADSIPAPDNGSRISIPVSFDRPGAHTVEAWVKDSEDLISPEKSVSATVLSDRVWFEPLSVDTSLFINQTIDYDIPIHYPDSEAYALTIIWDQDGDSVYENSIPGSTIPLGPFSEPGDHSVLVNAIGSANDTARIPLRINVFVKEGRPVAIIDSIKNREDLAFFINDTADIHISVTDSFGTVSKLLLFTNQNDVPEDSIILPDNADTWSGRYRYHIPKADTGKTVFRIVAFDNDDLQSDIVSDSIEVMLGAPQIRGILPEEVWVVDTNRYKIEAEDQNGELKRFRISFDEGLNWSESETDSFDYSWDTSSSGVREVFAQVMDDDSVWSKDTFQIRVNLGRPWVRAASDTLFIPSSNGEVEFSVESEDPNGSILRYDWDRGADGHIQSSTSEPSLYYDLVTPDVAVKWAVVVTDDHHLVAADTFWVYADSRPEATVPKSPAYDSLVNAGTEVALHWINDDKRDKTNTLFEIVIWGGSEMDTTRVPWTPGLDYFSHIEGTDRYYSYSFTPDYSASRTVFWRVDSKDSVGNQTTGRQSHFYYLNN